VLLELLAELVQLGDQVPGSGAGAWHLVPKLDKFCEQFKQHAIDYSQVRKNG